jgi:uncharacterized membrane protein (DUF485 family)
MLHGPAADLKDDNAADRKSRLGLTFFFVYLIVYVVFVLLCLFYPDFTGTRVAFGLNLAVLYGFFLIFLAILMGFFYHIACSRLEDKLNEEGGEV